MPLRSVLFTFDSNLFASCIRIRISSNNERGLINFVLISLIISPKTPGSSAVMEAAKLAIKGVVERIVNVPLRRFESSSNFNKRPTSR